MIQYQEEKRLHYLPSFVATPWALFEQECSAVRRLQLLNHVFSQFVRFFALIHTSDFLNLPHKTDYSLRDLFSPLQRPCLGDWIRIIRVLPEIMTDCGGTPFLPWFLETYKKLISTKYEGCVSHDFYSTPCKLSGMEAFSRLRNILAHGGVPPDEEQSERLVEHYLPILTDLIDSTLCIERLTVYRTDRADENTIQAVEAMGLNLPSRRVNLDRKTYFGVNQDVSECFLLRDSGNRKTLPLYPFIIGQLNKTPDYVFSEPILSYDGLDRNKVIYIGVHQKFISKDHHQPVLEYLFYKQSNDKSKEHKPRIKTILLNTEKNLLSLSGSKYQSAIFQERMEFLQQVNDFIFYAPSKLSGLFLVADSGVGKTSFLCKMTQRLLEVKDSAPIPILFTGSNLEALHFRNTQAKAENLGPIGNALRLLTEAQECNCWHDLLKILEAEIDIEGAANTNQAQVIIILDALNESPDAVSTLIEFDYLVHLARRRPWLKCIGSIRKTSLETLWVRMQEEGIDWPLSTRAYLGANNNDNNIQLGLEIPLFTEEQAGKAYERYQDKAKKEELIPACKTNFRDLPKEIQRMVSHPLMLQIFMHTFDGSTITRTIGISDLFEKFHIEYLSDAQAQKAAEIAQACIELGQSNFPRNEAENLINCWEKRRNDVERLIQLNPLEQLMDAGVIHPTAEGDYVFSHQLYFEFLLYRYFNKTSLSNSELIKRINVSIIDGLEEEVAAYRRLTLERLEKQDKSLVLYLVENLGSTLFATFCRPIFFELFGRSREIYDFLLERISNSDSPDLLAECRKIFQVIGDRDNELLACRHLLNLKSDSLARAYTKNNLVSVLVMSGRINEAREILEELYSHVASAYNPQLQFNILLQEGYIFFVTGQTEKALKAYDSALVQLELLRKNMSEEEYLNQLRKIFNGKGCAEYNIDANEACVQSNKKALTVDRQLEDHPNISIDLVNLGHAYWGINDYISAYETYEKAVEAAYNACYRDAIDIALIGRGIVLWSIGRFEEAACSLKNGLEIANALDYAWDRAYGLIYLSNVAAWQYQFEKARQMNEEAIELAREVEARYLLVIGHLYLSWKKEAIYGGDTGTLRDIEETLKMAFDFGMRGPELMLRCIRLSNYVASDTHNDKAVLDEAKDVFGRVEKAEPIKGVLELACLQVLSSFRQYRSHIDIIDFEDVTDTLIERKQERIPKDFQKTFIATRKALFRFNRS